MVSNVKFEVYHFVSVMSHSTVLLLWIDVRHSSYASVVIFSRTTGPILQICNVVAVREVDPTPGLISDKLNL